MNLPLVRSKGWRASLLSSLFVVLGLFCLGCTGAEETEQQNPPPIARVELPPAPKEGVPPSTEGQDARKEISPPAPPTPIGIVTTRLLNVRRAPSQMAEKVGILPLGERVLILGEEADWYHIKAYAGYLEGWTAKNYIEVSPAEGAHSHDSEQGFSRQ